MLLLFSVTTYETVLLDIFRLCRCGIYLDLLETEENYHYHLTPYSSGVEESAAVTISSEANLSVPISIEASKYEDVGSLDTEIEVLTSLDAVEYLLDADGDGDGVIDENRYDGNFSVGYYEEGRYKPRVTVRTSEGLLFSTDYWAMSLDVKADADQKDPEGAKPVDVAKAYAQAFIDGDRRSVEYLLGENTKRIDVIYSNPKVEELLRSIYSHVISWETKDVAWGEKTILGYFTD